jgi:hypothetical protein
MYPEIELSRHVLDARLASSWFECVDRGDDHCSRGALKDPAPSLVNLILVLRKFGSLGVVVTNTFSASCSASNYMYISLRPL